MKKIIILFILSLLIINVINKNDYIIIPSSSIRLRVIAASNNKEDIENKIIVKNNLEKKLNVLLKDAKTYKETENILKNSYDEINKSIDKTMKDNNINEKYTINYGYNYFPEKKKNGVLYKAGNYKSFVISLGKGEGDNFWCVLFPPLCLVDDSNNNNYSILIKDILDRYR